MRSSPTSRADRANSPPPEGTEGTGWHDLYVNEHWPVYDAQRKAIMFKAKAFNAGFAQAHGLRHMLSSDRDIEAVCEMVRGALQRVVGTWGWSMLRVRYMLQCNRRLQRFLTRLRQRHDTFVGNMFAHWKSVEEKKIQQLKLSAVRQLKRKGDREQLDWAAQVRELCVMDDVKRRVIAAAYWARRAAWRQTRRKWEQRLHALRTEEAQVVRRLRLELNPVEEALNRKRLDVMVAEMQKLTAETPLFEFNRNTIKIEELRAEAKVLIAAGKWSESPPPPRAAAAPQPAAPGPAARPDGHLSSRLDGARARRRPTPAPLAAPVLEAAAAAAASPTASGSPVSTGSESPVLPALRQSAAGTRRPQSASSLGSASIGRRFSTLRRDSALALHRDGPGLRPRRSVEGPLPGAHDIPEWLVSHGLLAPAPAPALRLPGASDTQVLQLRSRSLSRSNSPDGGWPRRRSGAAAPGQSPRPSGAPGAAAVPDAAASGAGIRKGLRRQPPSLGELESVEGCPLQGLPGVSLRHT